MLPSKEVYAKIQQATGPHEDLLAIVKRRKLQWYGHISRSSDLAKTILQGTVERWKKTRQTEKEVGRQHQRMDRPGVHQVLEGKMEETGCEIICVLHRHSRLDDDEEDETLFVSTGAVSSQSLCFIES